MSFPDEEPRHREVVSLAQPHTATPAEGGFTVSDPAAAAVLLTL